MAQKFKERLEKALKIIASDVKLGEKFDLKFDPSYLDYGDGDFDEATTELFERSKLDPRQPFHWQFLLAIVAGVIYPDRSGRPVHWNADRENKLFRDVVKARKARGASAKKLSIGTICDDLRKGEAYAKISAATLQARFNIVLRKKRVLAKKSDAPQTLKNDLKWFAPS